MSDHHLAISRLLLQAVAVLLTARAFRLALRPFAQPPVMAEILAGIALGPLLRLA